MNSDALVKCIRGIYAIEFFEAGIKLQEVFRRHGYTSESAISKASLAYCLGVRAGIRKERQRKNESIK